MRIAEFQTNLAAYGTDVALWPAELRVAAARLLAESEEARGLRRSEERLDALFAAKIPAVPSAASITLRATAQPPQSPPVSLVMQILRPNHPIFGWARIVVLVSCLGAGLLAGTLSPPRHHDSNLLNLIDGSAFEVNDE